jgi:(E)-4-hydroxy-3-methylbut-2-enyl-diphosphate synthase
MLNAPAHDFAACVTQARALEAAGCSLIRAAIPDRESVGLIPVLKEAVTAAVVADIHFDSRLALESVAAGADKIRLNPGNIGGPDRVKAVARACAAKGVPIRVGVNGGSLEKTLLARHGGPTPQALAESALQAAANLEKFDFGDMVLSLKASRVDTVLAAYEQVASRCDYPLHLGVTEAGTRKMGMIKSAIGIGGLLARGIGDTIRVSLTDDPVREAEAAQDILAALGLLARPQVIACPTCGRTKIDLIGLAGQVETALAGCQKAVTVAVMGCAVNGPGEAREADVGLAGGDGCALLFKKGRVVKKVPQEEALRALLEEIDTL